VVAEAGAYATISNEAPARGKTVGSPIALEVLVEAVGAESDGVAVEEAVEAEAAAVVPELALITRKAIALVERAAVSHMMEREVAVVVEVEVEVAATAAATEAAAVEAEAEECAMTFSVAIAPGALRVAFHMKKVLAAAAAVVSVLNALSAEVAEAEAEAVDGVGRKTRIVLLVAPRVLLLVFATTSKKVGVLANPVDFPTMKQHPELVVVVVVVVAAVAVAVRAALKAAVGVFVSHGKRGNALVEMNVALLILENGFS